MPTEKLIRINLKLTQTSHRLFKIWCLEQGKTLQDGLEYAVKEMLKRKLGGAAAQGLVELAPGTWGPPPAKPTPLRIKVEDLPRIERETEAADVSEEEDYSISPDEAWAGYMKRGVSREEALAGMQEWCREEDMEGWKPPPAADAPSPRADTIMTQREILAADILNRAFAEEYTMAKPGPVEIDDVPKGPVTAAEFEVPPEWVARDGVSRSENLRRYGEDEAIEYWPPTQAVGLDVDAPIDVSALNGLDSLEVGK